MINLAFLDVDGVLTGKKYPISSPKVLNILKKTYNSGVKVILTTAKPIFSADVQYIIKTAKLDNLHITFAGALISNPLSGKVFQKKTLPLSWLRDLRALIIKHNLFAEYETVDRYYLEKPPRCSEAQFQNFAQLRHDLFGKKHNTADENFDTLLPTIVKVITSAQTLKQKDEIESLLKPYLKEINLKWSQTPQTGKVWWGMLTDKTISKKQSVQTVAGHYKTSLANCLGVGDSLSDWDFMNQCGYVATVDNASEAMKEAVLEKGSDQSFIGPSVDRNGIVDILNHFRVLQYLP